ncbi:VanZ family protein [Clostridiisalibacter paucivorans]|uniref:VanZ family protein n=1 Tax=Clostridiisalibacter paucivorans TaxID=408753 RepID=UPI00146FADA3|nr:VanZ family protein [Clostridiisalibacter paucivorans]
MEKRQTFIGFLLTIYIIMFIGVTFLNRDGSFYGNANLHFLSSYREAWNTFAIRNWQFIILNILMFVPLGILLPMLHKNFHNKKWTIGLAFILTLLIECVQLITGFGIFELDDIFNNLLGAVIGYGVVMGIFELIKGKKHRFLRTLNYLLPLILVIGIFKGIFTYYTFKEFGNLSIAHNYKIDMKDAKIFLDIKLNNENRIVPIYKAPSYTEDLAKEFVIDFFENLRINTQNIEIDIYENKAIYWIRGNTDYNIWLEYLDGSYRYTDFSVFDDEIEPMNIDKDTLLKSLKKYNINLPKESVFKNEDIGRYKWTVEKHIKDQSLIEGVLYCTYYNDNTIKKIHNNIVTYNKVKDVIIKSESEAYKDLKDGKFRYFNSSNNIESIDIIKISLDYRLDSKGFYQPIYLFDSIIDEKEYTITIPAMK